MKIEHITHSAPDGGEGLLAVVLRSEAKMMGMGVNFLTPHFADFQVGTIRHPTGYVVKPHVHRENMRKIYGTGEVLVVQAGRIEVDVYTGHSREKVTTTGLKAGDVIVLIAGGHSIRVIEECHMIEVKQGPYYGRDKDKVEFLPED